MGRGPSERRSAWHENPGGGVTAPARVAGIETAQAGIASRPARHHDRDAASLSSGITRPCRALRRLIRAVRRLDRAERSPFLFRIYLLEGDVGPGRSAALRALLFGRGIFHTAVAEGINSSLLFRAFGAKLCESRRSGRRVGGRHCDQGGGDQSRTERQRQFCCPFHGVLHHLHEIAPRVTAGVAWGHASIGRRRGRAGLAARLSPKSWDVDRRENSRALIRPVAYGFGSLAGAGPRALWSQD